MTGLVFTDCLFSCVGPVQPILDKLIAHVLRLQMLLNTDEATDIIILYLKDITPEGWSKCTMDLSVYG